MSPHAALMEAPASHIHRNTQGKIDEWPAITCRFVIDGHKGYFTVNMDPNTLEVCGLFIHMSKDGSTVSGYVKGVAKGISKLLEVHTPVEEVIGIYKGMRFEPMGRTTNPEIPNTKSVLDYIARWIEDKFIPEATRDLEHDLS